MNSGEKGNVDDDEVCLSGSFFLSNLVPLKVVFPTQTLIHFDSTTFLAAVGRFLGPLHAV